MRLRDFKGGRAGPWPLLAVMAVLLATAPARAWIETTVLSDNATLEIDRDGSATVTHELMLRIRGGPLKSWSIAGIDRDAELLPDALVQRARSGRAAGPPLPLVLDVVDGDLKVEIDHKKGLRRGRYLMRFSYRTELATRGLLRLNAVDANDETASAVAELRWVGPRFQDGIDSVRVLFRIPRAANLPRIPDPDPSQGGVVEEYDGVFLSNARRASEWDELEVVRPHVAKGEPVVWRLLADRQAFNLEPAATPDPEGPRDAPLAPAPGPRPHAPWPLWALVLGIGYGLLVVTKSLLWRQAARRRKAEARALLRAPLWLRAMLAALALGGSAAVGLILESYAGALALMLLALLAATEGAPSYRTPLRGPGSWQPLSFDDVLRRFDKAPRLPGAWLDIGTLRGFTLFSSLSIGIFVQAMRAFAIVPQHGVLLALLTVALCPVFCTGRHGELPPDPVEQGRRLLKPIFRALEKGDGLTVQLVARVADATHSADELRLVVLPVRKAQGLIGIEVAIDSRQGLGGQSSSHVVLVRVKDGSESQTRLRRVLWTRGRNAQEQVTLLRPKIPTKSACVALVRKLSSELSSHPFQPRKSRANADGNSARTRKPPISPSPRHAA